MWRCRGSREAAARGPTVSNMGSALECVLESPRRVVHAQEVFGEGTGQVWKKLRGPDELEVWKHLIPDEDETLLQQARDLHVKGAPFEHNLVTSSESAASEPPQDKIQFLDEVDDTAEIEEDSVELAWEDSGTLEEGASPVDASASSSSTVARGADQPTAQRHSESSALRCDAQRCS